MTTRNIFLFSALLSFLILGCQKEPDFTNFNYETYNRVVGPNGGRIDFYGNYEDDNANNVLVSLAVPQGALDSMMVFNMYQFEDYELVLQMENGYAEVGSKFLYFVPFYESDGYHERGQLDLNYHLSLDFNSPVSVTYNFLADGGGLTADSWQEAELYFDHYKKTNHSYRLYRIKIPKLDEWGEGNNIYVNWNNQGYPDGYDRTDLYYIISGLWSSISDWGKGYLSLENWEPVMDFDLDTENKSVSFEISNTNYVYVVCRIIYIEAENVPIKITNEIEKMYPEVEIERAYFLNDNFNVVLSDGTYATFSKNGDFLYLINDNFSRADLPGLAKNYINANYADDFIKKITQKQAKSWDPHEFEILMRSGVKLFFDGNGNFSGSFQYGVEFTEVPAEVHSYVKEFFPGEFITNITFNNEDLLDPKYIVYLSADAKVYFDGSGTWLETLFYRIDSNQLPEAIQDYFATNYPNAAFSEINYTLSYSKSFSYEILTVDSKLFSFDDAGTLIDKEFENIEESELPDAISTFIDTQFAGKEITQISYHYYDQGEDEGYDVYFDDRLNIEFDASGNVTALYGNDLSHLPLPARNHVETNYGGEKLLYCNFDKDGYLTTLGAGEDVQHAWDLYFEGNLWVGLDDALQFVYLLKYEAQISNLIGPITTYLNTNYPGETTVHEVANYYSPTYTQMIYYVLLDDLVTELIFSGTGDFLGQLKKTNGKLTKKSIPKKEQINKRINFLKKMNEINSDIKKLNR